MDQGISVKQSRMIQGLAILMMLYHHLFSVPEMTGYSYRGLLQFKAFNLELSLAYFCKMTIALFAFVSGYGLKKCFDKSMITEKQSSIGRLLLVRYRIVFGQIGKLYRKFWIVFLVFLGVFFPVFGRSFSPPEYVANFLALDTSYNGTWWYILQYVKMVLLLPPVDLLFTPLVGEDRKTEEVRKKRKLMITFLTVGTAAGILLQLIVCPRTLSLEESLLSWIRISYFAVFLMGYFSARFQWHQRAMQLMQNRRKWTQIVYGLVLMLIFMLIRMKLSHHPSYARMDFLIAPCFIWGFLLVASNVTRLGNAFAHLGSLSTYMWLSHIFFYDAKFAGVVGFTHFSTGIFLTVLVISILTALALTKVEQGIDALKKRSKRRKKTEQE